MLKDDMDQLDFEIDFFERIIRGKTDFVDAMIPLADAYTKKGRIDEGLQIDLKLSELCPDDSGVFYNLACSYSLLHDRSNALATLKNSLDLGYDDLIHLLHDPDLDFIRKDPIFSQLIQRLKARH